MFDRILVPLDGSPLAESAIPHAEQFARIFGASIFLLQVIEPACYNESPKAVDPLSWQIRKAEVEVYMQGITSRLRRSLDENISADGEETRSRVEYTVREGKIAENIVDCAQQENIDLLILTTHGSSGPSRWSISSIAQKVLDLIYLPVLLVRTPSAAEPSGGAIHYRRIFLPIDSSRRAECALPAGIALARGLERAGGNGMEPDAASLPPATQLVLAAVVRPPELPIPEPYPLEIRQLTEQLLSISRQAAANYLEELKARLPVHSETYVLENNSASAAIQEFTGQEEEIDLVVLCAHGYSGNFSWPYGSVARNTIDHGLKPTLIIQDVPRAQVRPAAPEMVLYKTGRR